MPALFLGKEIAIALAGLFVALTMFTGSANINIADHTIINDSIEYNGYIDIDGAKEPFNMIIQLEKESKVTINKDEKKNENITKNEKIEKIEKPQGKVKVTFDNKVHTIVYEREGSYLDEGTPEEEEKMIERFLEEAHKYNNRTGITGKFIGRVNDFCKWVTRRG